MLLKAVTEQKAGKVEYRTEKNGIIHVPIGKKSFEEAKIRENLNAIVTAIVKAKPASAKGTYIKSLTISTTMGPGIKIDTQRSTTVANKLTVGAPLVEDSRFDDKGRLGNL